MLTRPRTCGSASRGSLVNSKQLEIFVKIAETGSLSKAAVMLHRGQPILSREIRELETALDTTLFHRTGHGVTLTETGRRLLPRAKRILDDLAEAEAEARSLGPTQLTQVTVAMPTTLGRTLLRPLVKEFYANYPRIQLHMMESTSAPILEWVMARRIDVAILYDTVPMPSMTTDLLCEEGMYLVAPASAPRLPATTPVSELGRFPLILPGRSEGLRILMEVVAAQAGIRLTMKLEADAFNSIRLLVEDGHGYSVLPYPAVEPEVERGAFQISRLVEPEVTRRLVLATCSTRIPAAGLNELVRLIRKVVQTTIRPAPIEGPQAALKVL
jgi:LysR family transcriptional regulator, nitrogen assimilation regulatory protein